MTKVLEAPERLLNGLGLAARAGRIRLGADAVVRAIQRGEARAVVIATDAPKKVREKLERVLSQQRLPYSIVLDGNSLGRALGRERVVAVAVTDGSLAGRVLELARAVES